VRGLCPSIRPAIARIRTRLPESWRLAGAQHGDPGNDNILAADGSKDTVDCGPGHDVVIADKADAVAKNCEVVHRR
jgi:hypothetical protein